MRVIKDQRKVLAHWVYTRDEWSQFRIWEWRRLGWLRYLISNINRSHSKKMPEVIITGEKVTFNGKPEVFIDDMSKLFRVHIRESGKINILEIFYQRGTKGIKVIRVPIPRGEIIQAIEVQECLSGNRIVAMDDQTNYTR